jgi:hypothetical protein
MQRPNGWSRIAIISIHAKAPAARRASIIRWEVFHDRKVLDCLQSDHAMHREEVDAGIEGCDRPFLQPGSWANKPCSFYLDQDLRELLAGGRATIRSGAFGFIASHREIIWTNPFVFQ